MKEAASVSTKLDIPTGVLPLKSSVSPPKRPPAGLICTWQSPVDPSNTHNSLQTWPYSDVLGHNHQHPQSTLLTPVWLASSVSLLCSQLGGRGALDQPSLAAPWSHRPSQCGPRSGLGPLHSSSAPSPGEPALGCQRAGLGVLLGVRGAELLCPLAPGLACRALPSSLSCPHPAILPTPGPCPHLFHPHPCPSKGPCRPEHSVLATQAVSPWLHPLHLRSGARTSCQSCQEGDSPKEEVEWLG